MATLEKSKVKSKKKIDKSRIKCSDKLEENTIKEIGKNTIDLQEVTPKVDTSHVTSDSLADNLVENNEQIIPIISEVKNNVDIKKLHVLSENVFNLAASSSKIPSAPKCEDEKQPSEETFLMRNKALLNTMQLDDIPCLKFPSAASQEQKDIPVEIKPYTETQLESFYRNDEIKLTIDFTKQFIDSELRGNTIQQHPLNQMLTDYLQALSKSASNRNEIDETNSEYEECQKNLFHIQKATYTAKGQCHDKKLLTLTHDFQKINADENQAKKLAKLLQKIKRLRETHVLQSFLVQSLRLYIENYVKQLCKHANDSLTELRLAISVLFSFQRRIIRYECFINNTREWLTCFVVRLYDFATWQDHLFILNHLLRSPAGVGKWGASFVQPPLPNIDEENSPFADAYLNHVIATLALILKPVDMRDIFLQHFCVQPDTTHWVVVDSDGEEDSEISSLRENDLVSFLNQIPLEKIFCCVLGIETKDESHSFFAKNVNEHHVLRLLAFCNVLLKILSEGLRTYNDPKYHQFSKRLCRIANHTLQYVTDVWELLKAQTSVQYAEFVDVGMLRRLAVEYNEFIIRAVKALMATKTLAALQFLSIVPYSAINSQTLWEIFHNLRSNSLNREVFIEQLVDVMSEAEAVYLLNVFANMALARNEVEDDDFIRTISLDLLNIGFINPNSCETFWKNIQNLLVNLCIRFPFLLGEFLPELQENPIQSNCLQLYEQLPLNIWCLREKDLDIISTWLLSEVKIENSLSRMILSHLNYVPERVSYALQVKCALKILEYNVKNLPNQHADIWCWQILKRMRLHLTDRGSGVTDWGSIKDIEFYTHILVGVKEKNPLASFLSILITSHGHLVPLIMTKGLEHLELLLSLEKYDPLLFALSVMVPIFLNSQETLINYAPFQNLLHRMIKRPQILETWMQMIAFQITSATNHKFVIRLWFNSCLSVANWYRENGVLTLLNSLLENCLFFPDCLHMVLKEMRLHMIQINEQINADHQYGFFMKLFASNPNLPLNLATNPFLSYLVVKSEFLERECKTGLWNEILTELNRQTGKISVDNAIRKATSTLKIAPFSSSSLSFYRWTQLALEIPANHPLLPLVWQEFFVLYLQRVSVNVYGSVTIVCVGDKFFSGLINQNLFKKLKNSLLETAKFHQKDSELCKLFHTYSLWLEEPKLQEVNVHLTGLPAQYEPGLLAQLFQGSKPSPWFQYIRLEQLEINRAERVKGWLRFCNRQEDKILKLANPGLDTETAEKRIFSRLSSYDVPVKLPQCKRELELIPITEHIKPYLMLLLQYAEDFASSTLQEKQLNSDYLSLVPKLYKTVNLLIKKRVSCGPQCTGTAEIHLSAQDSKLQEAVQSQIQNNRSQFDFLLSQSLQAIPYNLCIAGAVLESCIKTLHPRNALEMYYDLIKHLNEVTLSCPVTAYILRRTVDILAGVYVADNGTEQWKLLNILIEETEQADRHCLIEHFKPESGNFLLMYELVCGNIKKASLLCNVNSKTYKNTLVLLSKFRVDYWLGQMKPKLTEISKFLDLLLNCLEEGTITGGFPERDEQIWRILRMHIMIIFMHKFPENYGVILMKLLNVEQAGNYKAEIWKDIINALIHNGDLDHKPLTSAISFRQYAITQKLLRHDVILDTTILFAKHFSHQRLKQTFGLYQKYRDLELDSLSTFISMTSHSLVITSLNIHKGELANKICETMWPHLRDMYSPWIVPTTIKSETVLPWLPDDQSQARKIIEPYFQTVNFLLETLPSCNILLNFIWQWYCTYFTHPSAQETFINGLVHPDLMGLCWHRFHPSISDVEFMFKIVDSYLPECHIVLGSIFVQVSWSVWLRQILGTGILDSKQVARLHQCLLNLLVKLCNEPNVRQNFAAKEAVKVLLIQMAQFEWGVHLDIQIYQQICDWFIISYDPVVIFCTDPTDLDFRVLDFLRKIGEDDSKLNMRQCFFKCFLKLMAILVSKNKGLVESRRKYLDEVLLRHLLIAEKIIYGPSEDYLMAELLILIVKIDGSKSVSVRWLEQSGENVLTTALRNIWQLNDLDLVAKLHETILSTLLDGPMKDLNAIIVQSQAHIGRELEHVFVQNGYILSLYITALDKSKSGENIPANFSAIISWLKELKSEDELTESKLPLLWSLALKMCFTEVGRFGCFIDYLTEARQDRSWTPKILGAIGMSKQESKFKFMCRSLESFLKWRLTDGLVKKQVEVEFVYQGGVSSLCFQAVAKRVWDSTLLLSDANIFLYEVASQLYSKSYFEFIQSIDL